jgi:polar amino acid transport system substrate-binding protein
MSESGFIVDANDSAQAFSNFLKEDRKRMKLLSSLFMGLAFSMNCLGAEVRVGFGDKLPPFCLPETSSGIEVDIFREALAFRGHTMKPLFFPIKRVAIAFAIGDVDAAMMDSGMDLSAFGGIYARPAIIFDNVFITLSDRHIKIKKPEDLNGLTVMAFPGALQRYPQWLQAVKNAGNYSELNNQALYGLTLQKARYDVVLSDRYIFRYFSLLLSREGKIFQTVDEHSVIKPNTNDYRSIFRNMKIKNDFEAGLKKMKETGRYQAIYDRYLK